ncbi:MAG: sensor histidine kinase [Bacteroidales bacterium]|jgi:signal transduction histidine kinase|nr:sensor histidine kinase [Bacteroidales bacterium]
MKKIICFWILSVVVITAQAQKENIDSLVNVVNTQALTPAEQIEIYHKISHAYHLNNPKSTVLYAKKGLAVAEKEKDRGKAARFSLYIGMGYDMQGKGDSAILFFNQALTIAKEAGLRKEEATVLATIANMYGALTDYDIALEYLFQALAIYESMEDKLRCGRVLSNIGSIYRMLTHYDRAIYYLNQGIAIVEELNNDYGKMVGYYDLSSIYRTLKEYDKALDYGLKTIEMSRHLNDAQYEILSGNLISEIYFEGFEDYDKAMEYVRNTIPIAERFGSVKLIADTWSELSNIYLEQGHYRESEAAALKAWNMDSTNTFIEVRTMPNLVYANIYLDNKEQAVYFLEKCKKAFEKFFNESYSKSTSNLEVRYETEKKELRIASLEKERRIYIWLGISGGAILLLAFGMLFYRYRMNIQKRKVVEQQRELAERKVMQLEQEKQLVAAQSVLDGESSERTRLARDLHDGLGSLLSIVKLNLKDVKSHALMDLTDVERFGKALEVLDESIVELRRVAHHLMPESLMRYGLRVSLEDFCRAIPGASFQYYGNDDRPDSRLEVLIYRCTYELVNNAVKYAEATAINVQLIADDGLVSLTLHDNGCGFDPLAVTPGVGLENIRTRVSAYNGKMDIRTAQGKGTEISIEIMKSAQPVHQDKKTPFVG